MFKAISNWWFAYKQCKQAGVRFVPYFSREDEGAAFAHTSTKAFFLVRVSIRNENFMYTLAHELGHVACEMWTPRSKLWGKGHITEADYVSWCMNEAKASAVGLKLLQSWREDLYAALDHFNTALLTYVNSLSGEEEEYKKLRDEVHTKGYSLMAGEVE